MSDALFVRGEDGRVTPTELARGPWSADALHGGPVAALVAGIGEQTMHREAVAALQVTRLTLDLERPVPLAPLQVTARVVRPGRKVTVVEVELHDAEDRRLARASLLGIRTGAIDLPADRPQPADTLPDAPESLAAMRPEERWDVGQTAFHTDGVEHRFALGGFLDRGPATDWIRLAVPVLADEAPSPLQRVAAAADFGNGISSVVDPMRWAFVNPDLTISLHRPAAGAWIGVAAVTRLEDSGVGASESDLFDEQGRVGRAVQSLLVEAR
jgi:uncharacterized protein (TIGR00369 family)